MSWQALLGYFRTWSALHTFKERNPGDAAHPDGPLEVRFWKALREGAGLGDGDVTSMVSEDVEVEWPVAMVVARRAI